MTLTPRPLLPSPPPLLLPLLPPQGESETGSLLSKLK